jgi:hypothetical protein
VLVALGAGLTGLVAGCSEPAAGSAQPAVGAQIAIGVLAAALLCDAIVLVSLPRRRISFGPLAPQLFMLAGLRALVALALAGLVALLARGVAAWLGAPYPVAVRDLAWLGVFFNLIAQTLGCALTVRAFAVEPARLGVTPVSARSPRLQGRLRVLQIGDLHIERRSVREEQLQRAIEHFRPDMLLFTGDFLNLSNIQDRAAWARCARSYRNGARRTAFVVSGSLVDRPGRRALLAGLPITWLRNQAVIAGPPESPVRLVGVTCTHVPGTTRSRWRPCSTARPAVTCSPSCSITRPISRPRPPAWGSTCNCRATRTAGRCASAARRAAHQFAARQALRDGALSPGEPAAVCGARDRPRGPERPRAFRCRPGRVVELWGGETSWE